MKLLLIPTLLLLASVGYTQSQIGKIDGVAISAPSAPAAGLYRVYLKTGTGWCQKDSAGTETCIGSGSGATAISGLTDLKVTIATNVATLAAGKVACGSTVYSVAETTFTLASGTAPSYIGFDCANAGSTPVTLARGGANTMSGVSGYTDSSATDLSGFPNIVPLASITISGANWLAVTDLRTLGSSAGGVVGSTGITVDADSNGLPRVGIDSTVATYGVIQSGVPVRCLDDGTGSDDTYTCAPTQAYTAYTDGMVVELEGLTANTGAATVNVSSLGAKSIKKCDGSTDPANSDIAVGVQIPIRYDGTVFRLPCNPATVSGGGATTTRGVIASRPGSGTTSGDMYYATDGIGLFSQWNGSSWADFYQGTPITRPVAASSWTLVNGGTLTDSNGFVVLKKATAGLTIAVQAQADTAWTATLGFIMPFAASQGHECGIYASTGTTAGTHYASGLQLGADAAGWKWYTRKYLPINGTIDNAAASLSLNGGPLTGGVVWMRIARSSNTFTYYYGDGYGGDWTEIGSGNASIADTAPTHLGFGCDTRSSIGVQMKVIHWDVQ